MILTFSPNPALERVALVDSFTPGAQEPRKPMRVSTFAGGAGLRAATVIRLLGGDVLAIGFVGGHLGALLRDCLDKQDVPHVLTPLAANTRGDFVVLDREKGIVTEIPERAPAFTDSDADKLLAVLDRHLSRAQILLIADGQSAGDDDATDAQTAALFSRAIEQARAQNVPILADISGAGWPAVIENGAWLLRVNLKTLQKRTERSLQHDSAIIDEARQLIASGNIENVVVTLGDEGALLVSQTGAWRVKAPVVSHFNATGSGETLSGALAVHYLKTSDLIESVRYGCAAASVNVTHDEPGYASPGEVGILFPRTVAGPVIQR